jgi:hypothetical protein
MTRAGAEVIARRAALAATAAQVSALEELQARGRQEHAKAVIRYQDRQVDDLVTRRAHQALAFRRPGTER